jgi:hypothetical protein
MAKRAVTEQKHGSGYWREAEARVVVAAWRQSGATLTAFARSRGVHPRRLARWARRLEGKRREPVRFHPVRLVEKRPREAKLEIVLRSGCRVRVPSGFAVEDLRRVLEAVGAGS